MTGFVRTEFATSDPDVALAMMSAAYMDTRMRFSGSMEDLRLEHVRNDLGAVRLDDILQTLTTDYVASPYGCLQIIRVVDHTMTFESGSLERRYGPGEVFLAAQPDASVTSRVDRARLQTAGLDLSLIAEVTGEPPLDVVRRFPASALPADRADFWQRAVT